MGAIANECGVSSRDIGAISIRKQFSVVEVAAELADQVLAALNKGVFICGTRISAKADNSAAGTPYPRKTFGPGARRRQPGAYGKKPRGVLGEPGKLGACPDTGLCPQSPLPACPRRAESQPGLCRQEIGAALCFSLRPVNSEV